jgi:hypothetical protein
MQIAHQARREVELEAVARGERYTRDQVVQRIAELDEWRRRAERAEHLLAGSRRRERELEQKLAAHAARGPRTGGE